MTDTIEHEQPIDGRSLRSVRTRRAIVEAFLDLVTEGQFQPTSQQVADRSGVAPSTIFRLFEDLEGMHAEALSIQAERVAELLVRIPREGAVDDRVERLVRARGRLYEKTAPLFRYQGRMVATSPGAQLNRAKVDAYFRAELAELFVHELETAPCGALESIDAFTSWQMWERLRSIQGLSIRQTEETIRGWMRSALHADP
jgi:AcrR family transcriptional regulator